MGWFSWVIKRTKALMSALAPEDAAGGEHRPRPRANTSFLAWRKNVDATPTSLASPPAIPIQTLPIDTLIQFLAPPSEPSLQHARSLVTALTTQTPAPPPSELLPIVTSLCATDLPPSVQAVGFEVFYALCSCGASFEPPDRSAFFDILKKTADCEWFQEVWEPRLKALNALFPSAEDVDGMEMDILQLLSTWATQAFHRYWEDGVDYAEREGSFEGLSHALTVWFDVFESCGRLNENDSTLLFDFYWTLVDSLLQLPTMPTFPTQQSIPTISAPTTPQREGNKHKRHPSSAVSVSSPLSGQSRGPLHQPIDFITSLYVAFLKERLERIPLVQLPVILPLLFRVLASVMADLPTLSPAPPKRKTTEIRIVELLGKLLWGTHGTTCLDILRQSMAPRVSDEGEIIGDSQIKESAGAIRTLRLQIRLVLEDRMAVRIVQRGASFSATPAGVPASSLESYLIDRAKRAWSKESAAMWDARKVSYFLVKAIRGWSQTDLDLNKEVILAEIAGVLKDVLMEMEDRVEDQEGPFVGKFEDNVTGAAVGRALAELVSCVKVLQ